MFSFFSDPQDTRYLFALDFVCVDIAVSVRSVDFGFHNHYAMDRWGALNSSSIIHHSDVCPEPFQFDANAGVHHPASVGLCTESRDGDRKRTIKHG